MNALRSTLRPIARAALPKAQKRQMGSGAAPQWTGIDKVIRDKFPEDYQGECETIIIKKNRTSSFTLCGYYSVVSLCITNEIFRFWYR